MDKKLHFQQVPKGYCCCSFQEPQRMLHTHTHTHTHICEASLLNGRLHFSQQQTLLREDWSLERQNNLIEVTQHKRMQAQLKSIPWHSQGWTSDPCCRQGGLPAPGCSRSPDPPAVCRDWQRQPAPAHRNDRCCPEAVLDTSANCSFRGLRTPAAPVFELCVTALKGQIYLFLLTSGAPVLPT